MEKFISEVQQVHGDVRGGILNQLVDCCASGNITFHCRFVAIKQMLKIIWALLTILSKKNGSPFEPNTDITNFIYAADIFRDVFYAPAKKNTFT